LGEKFLAIMPAQTRTAPQELESVDEWVDISIEENRRKLQELREDVQCYPVVAHGCRVLFEAPTRAELADHLRLRRPLAKSVYDVLILGAGPAGLGAAV
jgi:thioredoxin reductase (NADPH)